MIIFEIELFSMKVCKTSTVLGRGIPFLNARSSTYDNINTFLPYDIHNEVYQDGVCGRCFVLPFCCTCYTRSLLPPFFDAKIKLHPLIRDLVSIPDELSA